MPRKKKKKPRDELIEKVSKLICSPRYFFGDSNIAILRFAHGKSDINVTPKLKNIIEKLKDTKDISFIRIIGHTSSPASRDYNYRLGLKRASRFKNLLIKNGIRSEFIQVESQGESQLLSNGIEEMDHRVNRRIELEVVYVKEREQLCQYQK